jgi:hypothetical protein
MLTPLKGNYVSIALFDCVDSTLHTAHVQGILQGDGKNIMGISPLARTVVYHLDHFYFSPKELDAFLSTIPSGFDLWLFPCSLTSTLSLLFMSRVQEQESSATPLIIRACSPTINEFQQKLLPDEVMVGSLGICSDSFHCIGNGMLYAPGISICAPVSSYKDDYYSIQSGTSCATALTCGFMALLIAEFKEHFTDVQIGAYLKRIIHNTYGKIGISLLDMRIVTFSLHALCAYKKKGLLDSPQTTDAILQAITYILTHPRYTLLWYAWYALHYSAREGLINADTLLFDKALYFTLTLMPSIFPLFLNTP